MQEKFFWSKDPENKLPKIIQEDLFDDAVDMHIISVFPYAFTGKLFKFQKAVKRC